MTFEDVGVPLQAAAFGIFENTKYLLRLEIA